MKKRNFNDTPQAQSQKSLSKSRVDKDELTISIGSISDELDYMIKPITCKGDTIYVNL
jgi:hypothetical protein